jgi:hypothetical protein
MAADHVATKRYIQNTAAVVTAGEQLQDLLGARLETLDYAVSQLEAAARDQDADANSYRAFMFSELKAIEESAKEDRQRMSEDVFASVLVDLQVANVLISAGEAVGELPERKDSQHLTEALTQLKETAPLVSGGLTGGSTPGRFNFSGSTPPEPEVIKSADLESAIETFRKLSNEALDKLVAQIRGVAAATFSAMKKLTPEKILEALNGLGAPVQKITQMVGRLFRQGLQKLQQTIDDLTKLVGIDAITKIKNKISELWKERESGLIDDLLARMLGVKETRDKVTITLALNGLDKDVTDQASNDMSQLLVPFSNNVAIAKKTIEAISFATGILFFTPIAGQKIALFAAASYLLILSVVVLVAMDYADSGRVLKIVRGVGEITNSLKPKSGGEAQT